MHTRSPWWHENGIIHAKAKTWTPDYHDTVYVARVDLKRDNGLDNAQLIAIAPEMLAALQEIDRISIDIGLEVTLPESPGRNLVYDIHVLAADAILKTQIRQE